MFPRDDAIMHYRHCYALYDSNTVSSNDMDMSSSAIYILTTKPTSAGEWTHLPTSARGGPPTLHPQEAGPRFNIKMPAYQYRKSHCGDTTAVGSSYLHNGVSYTGKMKSLY